MVSAVAAGPTDPASSVQGVVVRTGTTAITGTVFIPPANVRLPRAFRPSVRCTHPWALDAIRDVGGNRRPWRISSLPAAARRVSLSAGYSDRERRVVTQGLRLTPNLSKPDEGLPTIFYPGEYTLFQSQKVRLSRDTDSTGTQIFLKDGPRYSLDVILIPEGVCARVAVVAEGAFVTNSRFHEHVRLNPAHRVVAGEYLILATNDLLASDVVRATTVNLSTEVKVVLQPTVNISGRVTGFSFVGRGGPGVEEGPGGRGDPFGPIAPGWRPGHSPRWKPQTELTFDSRATRWRSARTLIFQSPLTDRSRYPASGPGSYDVSIQPIPDRLM